MVALFLLGGGGRVQRKSFLQLVIRASWSYHLLAQTSFQLVPKAFWWAELISQFFCYLNSSKNITCLLGKLKTEFTSPLAKSTNPGLSDTPCYACWWGAGSEKKSVSQVQLTQKVSCTMQQMQQNLRVVLTRPPPTAPQSFVPALCKVSIDHLFDNLESGKINYFYYCFGKSLDFWIPKYVWNLDLTLI